MRLLLGRWFTSARRQGCHEIEIDAPNQSTARKVREAVEALAFDLDTLVEFEEQED